jgi:hypothetical protein
VLETRWYAQLGIPAFGYGAGRLDVSHGPEEYIDEAAMRRCAAVYRLRVNRVASASCRDLRQSAVRPNRLIAWSRRGPSSWSGMSTRTDTVRGADRVVVVGILVPEPVIHRSL